MNTITDGDVDSLKEAIKEEAGGSETREDRIIISFILMLAIGKPEMPE